MAFNMPPGCSPRDIPGNRPEDVAEETLYDKLHDAVEPLTAVADRTELHDVVVGVVVVSLAAIVSDAYAAGYAAGVADGVRSEKEIKG